MLNYRVLIFGNGCFRSWVTFLLLLPAAPLVLSPMFFVVAFLIIPPVYLVAALEEWVFRLVVEHNEMKRVPFEKTLNRLILASLIAPAVLSVVVLLPLAAVFIAPAEGFELALTAVAVAAGAITAASFLVTIVRKRAIVDDLLHL